jgi:hypothetical protein
MGAVAPLVAASIADAWSLATIFFVSTITFFLSLLVFQFGVKLQSTAA